MTNHCLLCPHKIVLQWLWVWGSGLWSPWLRYLYRLGVTVDWPGLGPPIWVYWEHKFYYVCSGSEICCSNFGSTARFNFCTFSNLMARNWVYHFLKVRQRSKYISVWYCMHRVIMSWVGGMYLLHPLADKQSRNLTGVLDYDWCWYACNTSVYIGVRFCLLNCFELFQHC